MMRMRTRETARALPSDVPSPSHNRLGAIEVLRSLLKNLLVRSEDRGERRENPLIGFRWTFVTSRPKFLLGRSIDGHGAE